MSEIDDDFDPDVDPPIRPTRCLALRWFDGDPMPAVCNREPHSDGRHVAAVRSKNLAPAWDEIEEGVA